MKILVCGDREWTDYNLIEKIMSSFPPGTILIHGACRGADLIAESVAKKLEMNYMGFPAKWDTHGKKAGPIRNREMLDQHPDLVIAFHENIQSSKGTRDCIDAAKSRNIKTFVISSMADWIIQRPLDSSE